MTTSFIHDVKTLAFVSMLSNMAKDLQLCCGVMWQIESNIVFIVSQIVMYSIGPVLGFSTTDNTTANMYLNNI